MCFNVRIACVLVVLSINVKCKATPIAVNNSSFESPDISDAAATSVIDDWIFEGGTQRGVVDPNNSSYPNASGNSTSLPGTASGFQAGFVTGAGGRISQNVGALLPYTTYTLTVAYGIPLSGSGTGWIELHAPGTGSVLAANKGFSGVSGTFVDASVSYTTGSVVSGDLLIRLASLGNETHYDNVRLDATTVPEPSFLAVFCIAIGPQVFCYRRRSTQRTTKNKMQLNRHLSAVVA